MGEKIRVDSIWDKFANGLQNWVSRWPRYSGKIVMTTRDRGNRSGEDGFVGGDTVWLWVKNHEFLVSTRSHPLDSIWPPGVNFWSWASILDMVLAQSSQFAGIWTFLVFLWPASTCFWSRTDSVSLKMCSRDHRHTTPEYRKSDRHRSETHFLDVSWAQTGGSCLCCVDRAPNRRQSPKNEFSGPKSVRGV